MKRREVIRPEVADAVVQRKNEELGRLLAARASTSNLRLKAAYDRQISSVRLQKTIAERYAREAKGAR